MKKNKKKILIIAQNNDDTFHRVYEWLLGLGQEVIVIGYQNSKDIVRVTKISFGRDNRVKIVLKYKNQSINIDQINVFYYRRGFIKQIPLLNLDVCSEKSTFISTNYDILSQNFIDTYNLINDFIFDQLESRKHLGSFFDKKINKLQTLLDAEKVGLKIPKTLITSSKKELLKFKKHCKEVICKRINNEQDLILENEKIGLYTQLVDDRVMKFLPEYFELSLFQEKIEKKFELRIFYFFSKIYAKAIFTQQASSKTQIDGRYFFVEESINNKKENKPNMIDYVLPDEVFDKLDSLMKKIKITTASIDFVIDCKGNHIFLEINPDGQLGGYFDYSHGYNISKDIAEFLINYE